jgi:O-acetyl-ADP-ribose deacetylase (regulator of RNase III)
MMNILPSYTHLSLIDKNPLLVKAWIRSFSAFPEVNIIEGDILSHAKNTLVSPANSYGDMGGGVDLVYRNYFGHEIERKVQKQIQLTDKNYLPVGQSLLVETDNLRFPYLIVVPTMFLPEPTTDKNCYMAMQALLLQIQQQGEKLSEVFCPGFGTGIGRISPERAANTMAQAYSNWKASF